MFLLLFALSGAPLAYHPPCASSFLITTQWQTIQIFPDHLTHISNRTALTRCDHPPWYSHSPKPSWCCPASSCLLTEVCLCSIITAVLLNHWKIQDSSWIWTFLEIRHLSCAAELSLFLKSLCISDLKNPFFYCIHQARCILILGNKIYSFKFLEVKNKLHVLSVLCNTISYISVCVKYCSPAFFTCPMQWQKTVIQCSCCIVIEEGNWQPGSVHIKQTNKTYRWSLLTHC